jgi:hypothetical protein
VRSVTHCPKCGSERIAFAHDEAPPWAKAWTKCFACGKRWNLDGGLPKGTSDDESTEEGDVTPPPKRTGEDIVKLVMDLSRPRKPGPKVKPIETKETTMRPRCTKGKCQDESADDSVRCPKHRDEQRASNARFQGRSTPAVGKPKRSYTRRIPLGGGTASNALSTLPAKLAYATITLAEPRTVNAQPARSMDLDGNVLTVLDGLIAQRESELVMLRGTKEILERHG